MCGTAEQDIRTTHGVVHYTHAPYSLVQAARPLVTVFNGEGKTEDHAKLPAVFTAPIRSDVGTLSGHLGHKLCVGYQSVVCGCKAF